MIAPLPPLFAAFAAPWMLWGLAGASLPIILHLLNRRRYREIHWAAMRFLLAAARKNQRRVRVEHWLLLLVRTLILVFLALAMARPALEAAGVLGALGGRRHWVLALDGSMSMGHLNAGETRFDRARELAERIVRDARGGDAFSVVLMSDPPRAVVGAPAFGKDQVVKAIQDLTLPDGGVDLPGSFRVVDEVLGASEIPRKEVVFVSDLQRSSWSVPASGVEAASSSIAKAEAKGARWLVVDLGDSADANRAIVGIETRPALATSGATVAISARVKAFGKPTPAGRALLVVDGRVLPDEAAEVPALAIGEEADLDFRHAFAAPGEHVVEVRLDPDDLPADDRSRLVAPIREAVDVLLVDGDPRPGLFESETSFLAEALSPAADSPGQASPIRLAEITTGQLSRTDLDSYDAVVLANVARLSVAESNALDAYLKQGGGLVVFTGDQVEAEPYNRILFDDGKGILPAAIGPASGDADRRDNPFLFDPLAFRHPIVRDFAGQPDNVTSSLTNVKTFRYHRLEPAEGATVAMRIGRDPVIVEGRVRRGRVVMVGIGADRDWTDWPIHKSYPPVMEKVVLLAASGRLADRNFRVGRPIDATFPAQAAGATATVNWPDRDEALRDTEVRRESVPIVPDGDVSRLRFNRTGRAGTYRIDVGTPLNSSTRYAANPDPAESDPAKLDAAGLRTALPGWRFDYDDDWEPLREGASQVGRRGEFHRPLLWGLLALVLIESILAYRFGYRRSRAA